jgi:hypothetical protein
VLLLVGEICCVTQVLCVRVPSMCKVSHHQQLARLVICCPCCDCRSVVD